MRFDPGETERTESLLNSQNLNVLAEEGMFFGDVEISNESGVNILANTVKTELWIKREVF